MKNLLLFSIVLLSINSAFARDLSIDVKKGMKYEKARQTLIDEGWQIVAMHTTPNGTPICWDNWEGVSEKESCKYEEIDSCSGSGMGFCAMRFFDGEDKYLNVVTDGGEPPNAVINNWSIENSKPIENESNILSSEECMKFLGAGMYNGVLENTCNFNGGVKEKILSMYDEAGCRTIIPQKIVENTAKDVVIDTKRRYEAMGHVAFCEGNIDAYNAL